MTTTADDPDDDDELDDDDTTGAALPWYHGYVDPMAPADDSEREDAT